MPADRINEIANRGLNDLAWLVGSHIAVRSIEQPVPRAAEQVLRDPDRFLRISNYPEAEAREVRRRQVAILEGLGGRLSGPPSEGIGAYLNKAAVLHADAVLQAALDQFYETRFGEAPRVRSVGMYIRRTARELPGFDGLPHVTSALVLAELRHVITHRAGIVDETFVRRCRDGGLWRGVWPSEGAFLRANQVGRAADLSIDTVVIPCIAYSAQFIEEARGAYLNSLSVA